MDRFEGEKFEGLPPVCKGCFDVTYAYIGLFFLSTLELFLCNFSGHTFGNVFVAIGYLFSFIGLYLGATWGTWASPGLRAGYYDKTSKKYKKTKTFNKIAFLYATHMVILVFVRVLYSQSRMGAGMPEVCVKQAGCTRVGNNPNRCGALVQDDYDNFVARVLDVDLYCATPRARVPLGQMQQLAVDYIQQKASMGQIMELKQNTFIWGLSISPGFGFPDDIGVYTFCEPDGEYAQAWIQMECRAGIADINANDRRMKDMTDYMNSRLPYYENKHNISIGDKYKDEQKIDGGRCDSDPAFTPEQINLKYDEATVIATSVPPNHCKFPFLSLDSIPNMDRSNFKNETCGNTYAEIFPKEYSDLKTFYLILAVPCLVVAISQLYILRHSFFPLKLNDVQKHAAIWGLVSSLSLLILSFDPNGFAGVLPFILAEYLKALCICSLLTNVLILGLYWYTLAVATQKMKSVTVGKTESRKRIFAIAALWVVLFLLRTIMVLQRQNDPLAAPGLRGWPIVYDIHDLILLIVLDNVMLKLIKFLGKMRYEIEKSFENKLRQEYENATSEASQGSYKKAMKVKRREKLRDTVLAKIYKICRFVALMRFIQVIACQKMILDSAPGEREMVYLPAGTYAFPLLISVGSLICMSMFMVTKRSKKVGAVGTSYAGVTTNMKTTSVAPDNGSPSEAPTEDK